MGEEEAGSGTGDEKTGDDETEVSDDAGLASASVAAGSGGSLLGTPSLT